MKKTKGIGPHNLGVSKAAVKKAYGDTTMTKKMGMGAESYGGAMANKNDYGNSGSMVENNKFAKAVQDAKAAGASTFEVNGKTYNVTGK